GSMVDLNYNITAGAYTASVTYLERIGIAQEPFETNTLTAFPWVTAGTAPWFTTTNNAAFGQYCSESGDVANNQFSELSISLNVTGSDSISFWYATDSEEDYDYLQFFRGTSMMSQWSGQNGWDRAAFAIPAGNVLLRWVYNKDYVYSVGQDCAWLDDITFPPFSMGVAIAEQGVSNGAGSYPNPADGPVTFFWNTASASDVQLMIYDATGRLVSAPYNVSGQSAGQHSFNWNTEGLNAGIYFTHIVIDGKTSVLKLVIR
ncbi:MAG TPA: T9SS type A sorting domain-containing protein, partial [Bacteroidia bacterium]|nr:T9SS type A sorting domain-containing protein [Bacteroidia bacterium]